MTAAVVPSAADGLVFQGVDGEPFTTSLVVAGETDNEHRAVLQLIRANLDDLNDVGRVAFEMRPFETAGGTQRRDVAELDEPASALLMTYLRNSPVVKDFKKRLVAGFYAMRKMLAAAPALTEDQILHRAMGILDGRVKALTVENKALTAAIERDAPLVAKAEAHTGSDSAIHRQEFAREVIAWGRKQSITIRQEHVMRFLGHIGLFIRGERTDTGHATADAIKRGLAFTEKGIAKNGHAWATGKLTASGQDYAWKRITKHVEANGTLELPRELRAGESA